MTPSLAMNEVSMIAAVRGVLREKGPDHVVLNVGAVDLAIRVPAFEAIRMERAWSATMTTTRSTRTR